MKKGLNSPRKEMSATPMYPMSYLLEVEIHLCSHIFSSYIFALRPISSRSSFLRKRGTTHLQTGRDGTFQSQFHRVQIKRETIQPRYQAHGVRTKTATNSSKPRRLCTWRNSGFL